MSNKPAQDRYKPLSTTTDDWEEHKYYDLGDGEIFFMKSIRSVDKHAYRKISDKEAQNTKMQTYHDVLSDIIVYTKL